MPPTLQVQVSQVQETYVVKLIGEALLDIEAASKQLDRVVVHHPKIIIVDASELTFISSIGMSLLVNLRRSAVKAGGAVKVAGLLPFVRDGLSRARLLDLFEEFPDVASALAAGAPGTTASA